MKNGDCCIGIGSAELEDLAKAGEEKRAQKCSTRELPLILAKNSIGLLEQTEGRLNQWGGTYD